MPYGGLRIQYLFVTQKTALIMVLLFFFALSLVLASSSYVYVATVVPPPPVAAADYAQWDTGFSSLRNIICHLSLT